MHYRRLGRTNLMVSVVGIGTTQLRRVPEKQAIETLKRAFELGVNLVNTGPDYEGADDLIVTALRETDRRGPIHLSIQSGGDVDELERVFEATCEKFGTGTLDLFGIAAISDQEAFGLNVWGKGGLVEFLQRKKQEGRLRALFASDHGSPEQMKNVLERDVFDALMLAYNPLGFHLITFRADRVWQIETPPLPIKGPYGWEDIPRTGREILPLAKERDVGILLMKPLAGGLLVPSKAFPRHAWREDAAPRLSATDVLRYLLMNDAVASVVPGMASVEEAEENARAGTGDIRLEPGDAARVEERAAELTRVLCSRCGHCDDLCSQGLPVSFIFRAAYNYLHPSAPFEISSNLQYFKLHPSERSVCATCQDRTCLCPGGIDIPSEMIAIHRKMVELRMRGLVPAPDCATEDWATGRPFSVKVLSREIPERVQAGHKAVVRLHLRNTGTRPWYRRDGPWHSYVALAVWLDGTRIQSVRLRQDVHPSGNCHFAFALQTPHEPGEHELRLDLFEEEAGYFSTQGVAPIRQLFLTLSDATCAAPA
jgi:predicted aldo/keto reductase-like oxidoreductase